MVLNLWPIFRLVALIAVVLIKKSVFGNNFDLMGRGIKYLTFSGSVLGYPIA